MVTGHSVTVKEVTMISQAFPNYVHYTKYWNKYFKVLTRFLTSSEVPKPKLGSQV